MNDGAFGAVVLAAGESSRMGRDKALLPYLGRTFLEVIVENLRAAEVGSIVVVLGHRAAEIRHAAALQGAEVVVNTDYRLGQTSSLQVGLRALNLPMLDGVLLCLVDNPAVPAGLMRQLCLSHAQSGAPVTIPRQNGRPGHPVMLGRPLFAELLEMSVNEGANSVIRKYRSSACWLDVDDPGVTTDVDEPDDYARLLRGN